MAWWVVRWKRSRHGSNRRTIHLDLYRAEVLRDCEGWIRARRRKVACYSCSVLFLLFETLSGGRGGDVVGLEFPEEL